MVRRAENQLRLSCGLPSTLLTLILSQFHRISPELRFVTRTQRAWAALLPPEPYDTKHKIASGPVAPYWLLSNFG